MNGFAGKILYVDLSSRQTYSKEISPEIYRDFIGGSGLAAKIFYDMGRFDAEPLSPDNPLFFMDGPFAGTALSGASRFYVAAHSPLTGLWGDSACGGDFAPIMKFAGFDGIILQGSSQGPVYLYIKDGKAKLLDASDIWGKETYEVTENLWKRHGKRKTSVLTIGPAGENGVRYASIHNNKAHTFGRAGFGALMGSKHLKALVVKANKNELHIVDPDGFKKLQKRLTKELKEGMGFQILRDIGTSVSVLPGTYQGDVPTKNWAEPSWEAVAEKLDGTTMAEKYLTGRHSCWACSVGCKRVTEVKRGKYETPKGPGPEYETIVSLGQLCLINDLEAIIRMNEMLNQAGMDSISFGATIAWAMECFEKGILTKKETEGLDLTWGNVDAVLALIPRVARREGTFAHLLAEGSQRAADVLGQGAMECLTTVKGMEAPMHDPRAFFGLGLAYAAGSNRGACHVATSTIVVEQGASFYPELGLDKEYEPMSNEDKAELVAQSCFVGSIHSSASICQFAQMGFQLSDYVALFNAIAGYDWDLAMMMEAAQRVWYLKRSLNHLFGLKASDDVLPLKLKTVLSDGPTQGAAPDMKMLLNKFYRIMDLDPKTGKPSRAKLEALGLEAVAKRVWSFQGV